MRFAEELRFGAHAKKRRRYLLENIEKGRFQPGAFLIAEAEPPRLFEIYPSYWLLEPHFKERDLLILGIGYGRPDTLRLLQKMVEERLSREE